MNLDYNNFHFFFHVLEEHAEFIKNFINSKKILNYSIVTSEAEKLEIFKNSFSPGKKYSNSYSFKKYLKSDSTCLLIERFSVVMLFKGTYVAAKLKNTPSLHNS